MKTTKDAHSAMTDQMYKITPFPNMSNQTIVSIQSIIKNMETEQFYKMETVEILACIIDKHTHSIDEDNPNEIIEALDTIEAGLVGDFTLEFDGNEYRIICDNCIWVNEL